MIAKIPSHDIILCSKMVQHVCEVYQAHKKCVPKEASSKSLMLTDCLSVQG